MISSTAWVPRGYAAEFPEKYELNDEEMERITAMAKLQLSDEPEELNNLKKDIEIDDDLKEYNLETYDEDDDEGEEVGMLPGLSGTEARYHEGEDGNDPYLSLPNEEDENLEKEDLQIYPTDNLILSTRTEDDISYLDVYVYDDGAGNINENGIEDDPSNTQGFMRESSLYVHHDLMLPAFPLCVEWINYRPNSENNVGNFAAIGTFDPQIEIWNLDSVDKAFPDLILGEPEENKPKKKSKKKNSHNLTHHTDAVLSLSHNRLHRNVLVSTSADATVKLWDLNNGTAVRSFNTIHNGKTVSSSQWHPSEDSILLTGGYDSKVGISDVRLQSDMTKHYSVGNEDIETVKWGAQPEIFHCGTDKGNVYTFDIRNPDKPIWTLHAHDAGISSLEINHHIPGMMITSAMSEKYVKLWKITNDKPSMVLSRDFDVGNILTCSIANDIEVAGNIVVGGVNNGLKLWDSLNNKSVRSSFKSELKDLKQKARKIAEEQGKFSRISNKYDNETTDQVMAIDEQQESDEEDDEDED
ncbi:periodic tryptophan protein 1 [[Candida] jaroonii]|uniref:Periodic tryptophan protein 1 n=1 Tax=[Candida] jaroonii TaxID=467808 RepID=A0ACA9Y1T9_9ASCO|nr:periodic tryptophan protein 1 [[Candida] jaroonii]